MTNNSTKSPVQGSEVETAVHLLDDWFDPIETGLRDRVRELIQTMIESELEAALSRYSMSALLPTPWAILATSNGANMVTWEATNRINETGNQQRVRVQAAP